MFGEEAGGRGEMPLDFATLIKEVSVFADMGKGVERRRGMDLRPVEGVRAIGPVGVKRSASDVAPAFAVDGSGRLEEDFYGASASRQDRGLEEEDAELTEDTEDEAEAVAIPTDLTKKVNLFA